MLFIIASTQTNADCIIVLNIAAFNMTADIIKLIIIIIIIVIINNNNNNNYYYYWGGALLCCTLFKINDDSSYMHYIWLGYDLSYIA